MAKDVEIQNEIDEMLSNTPKIHFTHITFSQSYILTPDVNTGEKNDFSPFRAEEA